MGPVVWSKVSLDVSLWLLYRLRWVLINRHYSLEVVQHPLRARMCGFGDKVRPSSWKGRPSRLNVEEIS